MSEGNGVARITRKGRKKFAFGDAEPFEIDVIEQMNRWFGILDGFRDDKGAISTAMTEEINRAAVRFAVELSHAPTEGPDALTETEALEFVHRLIEEGDGLRPFFTGKSSGPRSSPESTELILSEDA